MIIAIRGLGRKSQCRQCMDLGTWRRASRGRAVSTTGPERHGCTKAEPDNHDRPAVFVFKPGQGGSHIFYLGSAVVLSLAAAGSAEVETQNREAETPLRRVQHLHGVVHHFVVKGSAAQRMRMANQCSETGVGYALIEQALESSGRPCQIHTPQPRGRGWGGRRGHCHCRDHSTDHFTPGADLLLRGRCRRVGCTICWLYHEKSLSA